MLNPTARSSHNTQPDRSNTGLLEERMVSLASLGSFSRFSPSHGRETAFETSQNGKLLQLLETKKVV